MRSGNDRITRRRVLGGSATIAFAGRATRTEARNDNRRAAGGHENVLATLDLVNDYSTLQVAGVPTPTFGWVFKQGDIPAGTAPKFLVGGATQTFSAGLQRYWPDGSLMRATFMLLPTLSVQSGATQHISVLSGGS